MRSPQKNPNAIGNGIRAARQEKKITPARSDVLMDLSMKWFIIPNAISLQLV